MVRAARRFVLASTSAPEVTVCKTAATTCSIGPLGQPAQRGQDLPIGFEAFAVSPGPMRAKGVAKICGSFIRALAHL